MKNRERQRANRRMKQEFLSMRNDMGIKDPIISKLEDICEVSKSQYAFGNSAI